jgi:hypothetical protein
MSCNHSTNLLGRTKDASDESLPVGLDWRIELDADWEQSGSLCFYGRLILAHLSLGSDTSACCRLLNVENPMNNSPIWVLPSRYHLGHPAQHLWLPAKAER